MGSPVKPREWDKLLTVKCRLCGGAKCKRCSESAAIAKTDSPIKGLHADFVTDRLLGMMRPSSRLMKAYKIADQFHKLKIAAVFNLTLPGEHPYCGDPLLPSGFPYDPEKDLMAEKIGFYNFGWEDMTTPSLKLMADIVKVMVSVLEDGHSKIAVHCHAGYGRTGLAIACALVFLHRISPDRAIYIVRRDRPGSIQTSAQAKFVREFHEYISVAHVVFALPFIHEPFTAIELTELQTRVMHGEEMVGPRGGLPAVLEFLCQQVEDASHDNSYEIIQTLVEHVPLSSGSDNMVGADRRGVIQAHLTTVYGIYLSRDTQDTNAYRPSTLINSRSNRGEGCISQNDLFPAKVAFNLGPWNWQVATTKCPNTNYYAALLLTWLEHLREPLLDIKVASTLPGPVSEGVTTQLIDERFRVLNTLPNCIIKTLDRLLNCIRRLQLRLNKYKHNEVDLSPSDHFGMKDALCARLAMAIFQLNSTFPYDTITKCAEYIATLVDEWRPRRRLQLSLETLQHWSNEPASARLPPTSPRSQEAGNLTGRKQLAPMSIPPMNGKGDDIQNAIQSEPNMQPVCIRSECDQALSANQVGLPPPMDEQVSADSSLSGETPALKESQLEDSLRLSISMPAPPPDAMRLIETGGNSEFDVSVSDLRRKSFDALSRDTFSSGSCRLTTADAGGSLSPRSGSYTLPQLKGATRFKHHLVEPK